MNWRRVLIITLLPAFVAAGGGLILQGVRPMLADHRVPEVVVEPGGRARAFEVEPDENGLRQQDVREIGLAFGRGARNYSEVPAEMFILGGTAYLDGPGEEARTAGVLMNTKQALGLYRDVSPSVILHLPEDRARVPLGSVLEHAAGDFKGPVLVFGVGRFPAGPPKWLGPRLEPTPRNEGLVFLAFRPAEPEAGATGESWRLQAMRTARLPGSGPAGTAQEVLARAREAGPRALTGLSLDCGAVELALMVYRLEAVKPAGGFIEPPLVEVSALDPTIVLDIRYAGTGNFTGRPVYGASRAYLVLPEARRLARVNAGLREQGYRLKIYDAYRPLSDHARLWELAPDKEFWAQPERGSRHSRGAAVDCTLVTLDGLEVEMPSGFDDFTPRAHRDYQGAPEAALRHRAILEEAMAAEGFVPLDKEWWHFDSPVWWEYPLRDIPLD